MLARHYAQVVTALHACGHADWAFVALQADLGAPLIHRGGFHEPEISSEPQWIRLPANDPDVDSARIAKRRNQRVAGQHRPRCKRFDSCARQRPIERVNDVRAPGATECSAGKALSMMAVVVSGSSLSAQVPGNHRDRRLSVAINSPSWISCSKHRSREKVLVCQI